MRPTYDTSDPIEYIKSNLTMLIETRVSFGTDRIMEDTEEFIQKAVVDREMVHSIQPFFYSAEDDHIFTVVIVIKEKSDSENFNILKWDCTMRPVKFTEMIREDTNV